MGSISIIGTGNMASAGRPGARWGQRSRGHRPRPGQSQGIGDRAWRCHCRNFEHRSCRGHRDPRRAVRQRGSGDRRIRGRVRRQGRRRHHQPHHRRFAGIPHPRGHFRRPGDSQGLPRGRTCRQSVQHVARRRSGGQPRRGPTLDVFIAGDDAQAKADVSAFTESLGMRPLDAGQLAMARALENATLLHLGLVAHSVKHTNFALGVNVLS
jgi:hypothetical protein